MYTKECNEWRKQAQEELEQANAWAEKWPEHCSNCQGWGQVDGSDPSVGLWGFEPCETCMGNGHCPRCASFEWTEAQLDLAFDKDILLTCSTCQWRQDVPGAGQPVVDGFMCVCEE